MNHSTQSRRAFRFVPEFPVRPRKGVFSGGKGGGTDTPRDCEVWCGQQDLNLRLRPCEGRIFCIVGGAT